MATTYKWIISRLECYAQHEGYNDVVFTIHWRRRATDGAYSADIYGSEDITFSAAAPFTPYADLTEAQVIGWLESSFGVDGLAEQKRILGARLEEQTNPISVISPVPWES